MNLFGSKKQPESTPTPTIDEARMAIEDRMRSRLLRGRASTMIATGSEAPTAKRTVLGN